MKLSLRTLATGRRRPKDEGHRNELVRAGDGPDPYLSKRSIRGKETNSSLHRAPSRPKFEEGIDETRLDNGERMSGPSQQRVRSILKKSTATVEARAYDDDADARARGRDGERDDDARTIASARSGASWRKTTVLGEPPFPVEERGGGCCQEVGDAMLDIVGCSPRLSARVAVMAGIDQSQRGAEPCCSPRSLREGLDVFADLWRMGREEEEEEDDWERGETATVMSPWDIRSSGPALSRGKYSKRFRIKKGRTAGFGMY